jgi:hypothetical protein
MPTPSSLLLSPCTGIPAQDASGRIPGAVVGDRAVGLARSAKQSRQSDAPAMSAWLKLAALTAGSGLLSATTSLFAKAGSRNRLSAKGLLVQRTIGFGIVGPRRQWAGRRAIFVLLGYGGGTRYKLNPRLS